MQFTHHDFYSNFSASIKSGDLDLTNAILANEISDFIVFDTDKIIQALNKSDVIIDKSNTDEEIVDVVIKNIQENKKMVKALAFIIAEGNELINSGKDANKQKQLKAIDEITNGINKIAKEISNDPVSFKRSAMGQIVSKASQRKQYDRIIWNKDKKGISGGWALLIGLGVITATVIFIYYRQKKAVGNAIPNMIMGGEVPPIQQTVVAPIALSPEPLPIPTPTPVI